jgi:CRISPR-associated endonuclease Cas2
MYKIGGTQKKILLALFGGVALGLSQNPAQYYRTLRVIKKNWKKINQSNFNKSVRRLSSNKLVEEKKFADGSIKLILTKEGKKQAKKLSLFGNSIKFKRPKKWDGKWRLVIFDIPEDDRTFRDILRNHLKELNFLKLQQSVFVSPYSYEKAISELTSLYLAEKYVRVITATKIDNESVLKNYFFK